MSVTVFPDRILLVGPSVMESAQIRAVAQRLQRAAFRNADKILRGHARDDLIVVEESVGDRGPEITIRLNQGTSAESRQAEYLSAKEDREHNIFQAAVDEVRVGG